MAALVGELELRVDSKEFITHTHIDDGDTAQKTECTIDFRGSEDNMEDASYTF